MNQNKSLIFALCTSVLLVQGCSFWGKKSTQDAAPRDKNVSRIKEPVPTDEQYSRGGNPKSYEVFGKRYYTLPTHIGYDEIGTASWYGTKFHGRKTSNGEVYDVYGMTAAHKSLPLPTFAEVTNLENGKSVIVRVNDRGPFVDSRLIDLSYAAAKKLGFHKKGIAKVKIRAIDARKGKTNRPPTQTPVVSLTNNDSKPVYLQLGAFKTPQNAQNLATRTISEIKSANIPVKVVAQTEKSEWLYKVVVGPIADINNANQLKAKIHALKLAAATIITEL
jgi:rare lipoprotein A